MLTICLYLRDFPADPSAPLNSGMDKAIGGLAAGIMQASEGKLRSVVLCEGPTDSDAVRPDGGYRVRCFDNRSTHNMQFRLARGLRDFVANEMQPGLVVLNAIFHTSVYSMSRLLRKHGVPYVAAPHDPYHPSIFNTKRWQKTLYWYLCERPMLRRAAAVQVLDARHGNYLRAQQVHTPVIEVLNGYTPADVPEESKLVWRDGNPDGAVRILFLGRMDRVNKGLDLLLDAFAPIAASSPDVVLTLQGADRSGERAILREQARMLGLTDRVNFLPPDYDNRPADIIAGHDLFVLPSRFEGFGLSAMEAILAGRPVVISDIAGLAPHVRAASCGVVVEPVVDSIRDGLVSMLHRRNEWRDMALRGRNYILETLDWKRIAAGAISEYRRLQALAEPPRMPRAAQAPL
jgi:glycosyltransferase involved in cell wall biosynthesis